MKNRPTKKCEIKFMTKNNKSVYIKAIKTQPSKPTKKCSCGKDNNPLDGICHRYNEKPCYVSELSTPTNCQDWEEEIRKLIYIRPASLDEAERNATKAERIIRQLLSNQRKEIIACLPKERTGIDFEPIKGDWNDDFNGCRSQFIKSLKDKLL